MAERRKLSEEEVQARLDEIPGWALQDGKLHRELEFGSFIEAFGFMATVALTAEKMDHHPSWFNVYNRVIVDLNTHDVGGVSTLDFDLAATINRLVP